MATATYSDEFMTLIFSARPVKADYGVPGSPVWTEYEDVTLDHVEFLGCEMPTSILPDQLQSTLLEYADEVEFSDE